MADFTHRNLSEVEDSAAKFGFGDSQEARFASEDFDTEQTGFSYHRVKRESARASATDTTRPRRSTS